MGFLLFNLINTAVQDEVTSTIVTDISGEGCIVPRLQNYYSKNSVCIVKNISSKEGCMRIQKKKR